jgi:hypothetical protein
MYQDILPRLKARASDSTHQSLKDMAWNFWEASAATTLALSLSYPSSNPVNDERARGLQLCLSEGE